ncbi:3-demethylubiquinone-9 3-methyltransferase [Candidatus Photodesmus blepharus]|uniref:Ubiquinone biosynthesis O-methyltransferase n=1 Tax=Candidatus Photodesmus blepharonis TaxID=1179155 RepID=A0A084CMR0_9GAMM|nr:bifunctional 2-polyprenyl-6-hydroxyphenol methylase/3-demethylubiquinol 3-O-methyltransferase UbiG [Candidatus Photodesmus blepharus]KEY91089.1 3-demethylubiquinone-9 3-methyltransferase [Candidatus Photodesmus blepharus]
MNKKAVIKKGNINFREVKKFEEISPHWWNVEGKFKPLHRINPLRLDYVLEKTNGLFSKKVLDVGCGGGIFSESMAKESAEVTGLDMGKKLLKIARLHALETGVSVNYIHSTVEAHACKHTGIYDIVTCMEMLEHVPDPFSVVFACSKLVKSDGHVFFSTLNRNLKSYLFAVIFAEKLFKIIPEGTHSHRKFIRPSELMRMIDRTDLQVSGIAGLHYNPVTDNCRFSSSVDINYIVHCQKF